MPGGRGEPSPVPWSSRWFCFPARKFLGVVAGFAESCTVVRDGGSAQMPRNNMIKMANGSIAVGCAAGCVAGFDKPAHPGREEPRPRIHGDQPAGSGCCAEAANPDSKIFSRSGPSAAGGISVTRGAVGGISVTRSAVFGGSGWRIQPRPRPQAARR